MINEDIVDLRQKYKRNPNVKLPTKNVMPEHVPENAVMAIVKNGVVVESDTYKSAELIIIPNGARHIGEEVFLDCESLTSVIIPDSVTSIGNWAFRSCESLTSITIPDSVTNIESDAFAWCANLTSITIPNSVTSIGDRAFKECENLTSINIPNSVTNIGRYAFSWCKDLKSITIPNSITNIDEGVFYDCINLTSVTIPSSVTSIGYKAFYKCENLKSITIPNSVKKIDKSAFVSCNALTSVTIPNRWLMDKLDLIFGPNFERKKIKFTKSLTEEIVDLRQKYKRNSNIKLPPAQQKASEPASKSFNINDYWRDYTYGDKGGFPWVTQSLKSPKMLVDRLNGIVIHFKHSVASLAALDYWIKTRWNSLETLYKVSPSELAFTRAVLEALIEISDSDPILGILNDEDMAIAARYVAAVVSFFIEECQPKLKEAIRVL